MAVIPVILFRLKNSWLQGGFLEVDIFFVISGFLITSIILREDEAGNFSFQNFWARRAKRILPVLITVVLASVAAAHLRIPSQLPSLLDARGETEISGGVMGSREKENLLKRFHEFARFVRVDAGGDFRTDRDE